METVTQHLESMSKSSSFTYLTYNTFTSEVIENNLIQKTITSYSPQDLIMKIKYICLTKEAGPARVMLYPF